MSKWKDLPSTIAANSAVIGTTAGLVGVILGATIASIAPLAAVVLTVGGTALAAGTLYQKLASQQKRDVD
jgi:hypothetical protein